MDAIEVIRRRRSVRIFTGDPIPREDLQIIVDAGRLAATGSNLQPSEFVVVTKPEAINHFTYGADWIAKAAAIVVIVSNPGSRWWVEDGSAAAQNMLIAATALGYGSCWFQGLIETREQAYKDYLGVPDHLRIFTLVVIGVPGESPSKTKKTLEQVLHWERF
jgi:nitroreductase